MTKAGTYSCKVGKSESCTTSDSVVVNVNFDAAVNLGTDTSICKGSLVLLNAGNVFKSIQWNTGDTTSSINVDKSGIYYVKVIAFNNTEAIDSVLVTVVDYPSVSISTTATSFLENQAVQFTATGVAESYHWDFGDFGKAEGAIVNHNFPIAGVYNVVLTAANKHCSTTSSKQITILQDTSGTGIEVQTAEKLGLLVFPNPADESITLQLDNLMAGEIELTIYSETGKLMYSKTKRLDPGNSKVEIDVDDWAAGVYFVNASNKLQQNRSKFIIGDLH